MIFPPPNSVYLDALLSELTHSRMDVNRGRSEKRPFFEGGKNFTTAMSVSTKLLVKMQTDIDESPPMCC